ncbi:MAG: hypothetical protein O2931_08000, partial [Planctomycetota bacterium]|nr:hypothetical protein [Planctomycetota bacterium]
LFQENAKVGGIGRKPPAGICRPLGYWNAPFSLLQFQPKPSFLQNKSATALPGGGLNLAT